MLSHGGIKYKKISLCWDVIISTHGDKMKRVMRRRFVPSSYQRDLRNRLQILRQGSKFVDDYFKEMELLLVRSGIREDEE
jgi:hypothetical protein